MLDRLVETICDFDDFCKSIQTQWEATLLTDSKTPKRKYGPEAGLVESEIMTLLVLYHISRFKNFKAFYNSVVLGLLRPYFPGAPCSDRFLTLTKRVWALLAFFLARRMGQKQTFITSTARRWPYVTTAGSIGTRCLLAWQSAARPAWAGFSALNCIWFSITTATSS